MDLVSIQKNRLAEKNESLTNGFGNGLHTNGTNGNYNRNWVETGHSDFMTIQRYEDLIGNPLHWLSAMSYDHL